MNLPEYIRSLKITSEASIDEVNVILEEAAKMAELYEKAFTQQLTNPTFVHVNILHGRIAKPTWEQIKHLYKDKFDEDMV